jgi:hypothetical protein
LIVMKLARKKDNIADGSAMVRRRHWLSHDHF